MKRLTTRATMTAFVVLATTTWSPANAALIATIEGNDCAGVFGQSFPECRIPVDYDENQSPVIIKFGSDLTVAEINTALFPSIDGSEFVFSLLGAGNGTGTWTYTPGTDDPYINFFTAKASDNFNLFGYGGVAGPPQSDSWVTPLNDQGAPRTLSHLVFYDTGVEIPDLPVPEPGSLLLLGTGLVGLGTGLRRRRRR